MEEMNKVKPEEMTIAKHLTGTLPRLRTLEAELDEYESKNPYTPLYPLVEKATYIGIECEIENVKLNARIPYWSHTKDGSLRNQGLEFITLPIKVTRVEQALNELFTKVIHPGYTYSPRTSTHIHMNVRTLTIPQLQSLILTYMVFERALFNWIGHERDQNIYCVPLYSIALTDGMIKKLEDIKNFGWLKYTALNLRPILDKGTIEFRHLYGTDDIKVIMTWINFLLCLKRFALRNKPDYVVGRIYELNTSSEYNLFMSEVFGDLSTELMYDKLNKDMSSCISNIKSQCFFNYTFESNEKLNRFINTVRPFITPEMVKRAKRAVNIGGVTLAEMLRDTPPPPIPELFINTNTRGEF